VKGTSFQQPYEFKLEVEGESWNQGEPLRGSLLIKNHGGAPAALSGVQVKLAYGGLKKVHAKSAEAFDDLASAPLELSGELGAGEERRVSWEFKTTRDTPITDNVNSPFVLYGHGESAVTLAPLQLNIQPDPLIQEVMNSLRIQFRFVPKALKFRKKGVEGKFEPPTSQAFASLDYVLVGFGFEGDVLELEYIFHMKKVEATAVGGEVKKDLRKVKQSMRPDQYKVSSGRWNHEHIEATISEALSQVETKLGF
jgi:hypothetical protein